MYAEITGLVNQNDNIVHVHDCMRRKLLKLRKDSNAGKFKVVI